MLIMSHQGNQLMKDVVNYVINASSVNPHLSVPGVNITQVVQSVILASGSSRRDQQSEFNPLWDAQGSPDFNKDCFNSTLFEQYIRMVVRNVTTLSKSQRRAMEGDPLLYIIAVLIFYSCGIVVLMINYMKKEQSELEETNLYKQYIDRRDRCDEFNNRGKCLNKLALQALNAVNVVSQQDGEQSSKIAFV